MFAISPVKESEEKCIQGFLLVFFNSLLWCAGTTLGKK